MPAGAYKSKVKIVYIKGYYLTYNIITLINILQHKFYHKVVRSFHSNSKTKIDCIIMNICQKQAEEETFLYLSNTL